MQVVAYGLDEVGCVRYEEYLTILRSEQIEGAVYNAPISVQSVQSLVGGSLVCCYRNHLHGQTMLYFEIDAHLYPWYMGVC